MKIEMNISECASPFPSVLHTQIVGTLICFHRFCCIRFFLSFFNFTRLELKYSIYIEQIPQTSSV